MDFDTVYIDFLRLPFELDYAGKNCLDNMRFFQMILKHAVVTRCSMHAYALRLKPDNLISPTCRYIDVAGFRGIRVVNAIEFPSVISCDAGALKHGSCKTFRMEHLRYAGDECFEDIDYSCGLYFPELTYIGCSAFRRAKINMLCAGRANSSLTVDICAFTYSELQRIALNGNDIRVNSFAFGSCKHLTEVCMDGCTELGGFAFYDASEIKELSLPAVQVLYDGTFWCCFRLERLSLPALKLRVFDSVKGFKTTEGIEYHHAYFRNFMESYGAMNPQTGWGDGSAFDGCSLEYLDVSSMGLSDIVPRFKEELKGIFGLARIKCKDGYYTRESPTGDFSVDA